MVAEGKIQRSKSAAGAPILLVRKANGEFRLCVDYRGLNKVTLKNRYPIPLMSELKECLNRAKIFTKLDLKNGYYLIRMAKGDEPKTAFCTRFGSYEWKVMPFGLCNAPATFQAMMDDLFHDMLDEGVLIYLDNILIYAENMAEHQRLVKEVLKRLDKASLSINAKKSQWHSSKVEFLGYIISEDGITMSTEKVQAVKDWPTPKTVKNIQEFLGFANFYRRFIENFAKVAQPLTELTKGKTP